MANNTILSPPSYEDNEEVKENIPDKYLLIDNCLSEYADNESYKERVRSNLDLPSYEDTQDISNNVINLSSKLRDILTLLTNIDDPYITQSLLEQFIKGLGYIKQDGSIPFTKPQKGVTPKSKNDLATSEYVLDKIKEHSENEDDPHNTLKLVQEILESYVKINEVYNKEKTYNKTLIDNLLDSFIKQDGSTAFKKPQLGLYPKFDSHLSTKRYVDDVMYNHVIDVDPHNYGKLLNSKLLSYAKIKNVYDKTETYSKVQLDSVIEELVELYAKNELDYHLKQNDPHNILSKIKKENYIKLDGSTPFKNPLKGKDAIEEDEFVTLKLLLENKPEIEPVTWKTSGPVETTVGFIEDNSILSDEVTVLEIFDAIFYGKRVDVSADEYVNIGTTTPITICIHGSLINIINIEVFQNGELINVLDKEQFENGCVTIDSEKINSDTDIEVRVSYSDGIEHNSTVHIKASYPVFIGLIPFRASISNITQTYLEDLVRTTNENLNKFISIGNDIESITFNYIFEDANMRRPFVVLPKDYPNLESITTSNQLFGIEAFQSPIYFPMYLKDANISVDYKVYVYDLPLVKLNQEVTFNFKLNESVL